MKLALKLDISHIFFKENRWEFYTVEKNEQKVLLLKNSVRFKKTQFSGNTNLKKRVFQITDLFFMICSNQTYFYNFN
jgi:hypothetical protein